MLVPPQKLLGGLAPTPFLSLWHNSAKLSFLKDKLVEFLRRYVPAGYGFCFFFFFLALFFFLLSFFPSSILVFRAECGKRLYRILHTALSSIRRW